MTRKENEKRPSKQAEAVLNPDFDGFVPLHSDARSLTY